MVDYREILRLNSLRYSGEDYKNNFLPDWNHICN